MGWTKSACVCLMINLKGPKGRCRTAHRGVKFSAISHLMRSCGIPRNNIGFGTVCNGAVVNKRGIVLVGPLSFVGLDNNPIHRVTGCFGVSPRSRLVIVCSSVSLRPKRLHVHGRKDTNKRGKVGSVVHRLNARGFLHVGMKINTGPGK